MTNQDIEIIQRRGRPITTFMRSPRTIASDESQPPQGDPKKKSFARQGDMIPAEVHVHPVDARLHQRSRPSFFAGNRKKTEPFTIRACRGNPHRIEALARRSSARGESITWLRRESKTADFDFKG